MKKVLKNAALFAAIGGGAFAGGIERSSQSVGILFEEGRYAEFSFGTVSPSISGVGSATSPTPGAASGDMHPSFQTLAFGYKQDFGDNVSFALIYDQPYGANVSYPAGTGYFAQGAVADLKSNALTGVLRYRFPSNMSVYGGLRYQTLEAAATVPFVAGYDASTDKQGDLGYLVGVAYEKPEIALRVALTYNSAITHNLQATETSVSPLAGPNTSALEVNTPQSVNLEFQSGVAQNTLVFGSIRWVEWSEFDISPDDYAILTSGGSLVSYRNDTTTYTLGVGRKLNDNWAAAVSFDYEKSNGGFASNLGPTDGRWSIGLGGSYTIDNIKITGGVRYLAIGDAQTTLGGGVAASDFADNSALAVGVRVGVSF